MVQGMVIRLGMVADEFGRCCGLIGEDGGGRNREGGEAEEEEGKEDRSSIPTALT